MHNSHQSGRANPFSEAEEAHRVNTRRPSVATRIQKGKQVLEDALDLNTKIFNAYKTSPGNENATVASSINGGNPYGNVLGHVLNALALFTGEDEAPVYRSFNDSNASANGANGANGGSENCIFAKMKSNCIFYQAPESSVHECIQEFNRLRTQIQDNTDFKNACISVLVEKGIVPANDQDGPSETTVATAAHDEDGLGDLGPGDELDRLVAVWSALRNETIELRAQVRESTLNFERMRLTNKAFGQLLTEKGYPGDDEEGGVAPTAVPMPAPMKRESSETSEIVQGLEHPANQSSDASARDSARSSPMHEHSQLAKLRELIATERASRPDLMHAYCGNDEMLNELHASHELLMGQVGKLKRAHGVI